MDFIPRKFKNTETYDIVDFERLVESSNLSVILGEPASGKTFQLEHYYKKNNAKSSFIKPIHIKKDRKKSENILLFDSIDEALINNHDFVDELVIYMEDNKEKKFILTCRYLEWKEKFEKELKEISEELKVYNIQELSDADINSLLDENKRQKFWHFINKNYLSPLLKNIMIVKHIVENFDIKYQNKQIDYTDIYKDIIKESISKKGEHRSHKKDARKIKKLLPISASLATYMLLNKEDGISNKDINDITNFVDKLYQIENKNIKEKDFEKLLDTALFEKKGKEITFFHKSILEYLTAYFVNEKKIDSQEIKKIFSHNLRFYEEFEEVIIYLTNMQPKLFDDFVEFDPFIFRRHSLLSEQQQKKLLLSILNKLQNSESLAWDRVNFFYNSSLVKFDRIDVYSLIKDKNIEKSQSDILVLYIMKLFVHNYVEKNKEFEEFIFQKLNSVVEDKYKCQRLISDSYHYNYNYNIRLFDFMQKNKLLKVANNPNNRFDGVSISGQDNLIVENMFLVLYGCKFNDYNQIIKIEKSDFDFKNLIYLLNYIKLEKFQEFTYRFMSWEDINIWTKYILDNYKKIEKDGYILDKNIAWMFFLVFSGFNFSIEVLEKIIHFITKHRIFPESMHYSVENRTELGIKNQHLSLLFTPISEDFWKLYFNKKISIDEVTSFLRNYYTININNIHELINKYPIEDYFIEVMDLIEKLQLNDNENISTLYFPLNKYQEEEIFKYIKINNIEVDYIAKLLKYNSYKELEDYFFEILEGLKNNKKECRRLLKMSLNENIEFSQNIYWFLKKNNLFGEENENDFVSLSPNSSPELEIELFLALYGFDYRLNKIKNDFSFIELMLLSEEISFNSFSLKIVNSIDIVDIREWFIYLSQYSIKKVDSKKIFFEMNIKWIIQNLLIRSEDLPLEEIILFVIKNELTIPKFNKHLNENLINASPLFSTISKEFWNIYFSDKIQNFKELENFINFYYINEKELEKAIEKHPIEKNIEKYYAFGVQYDFFDILLENKEYQKYISNKQIKIESLENREQIYLYGIQYLNNIQNYSNNNVIDIFNYALYQKDNNFKETDKKLDKDLKDNYAKFIQRIIELFNSLDKYDKNCTYKNRLYVDNYLFNILSTKKDIDNALKIEENYNKLFFYLIKGCIDINENLLNVIKEKFDLFINIVKEFIEIIVEKETNSCFDDVIISNKQSRHKIVSPCTNIIDIFQKIAFDKKQKVWIDFLEHINKIKKENTKYEKFFELIQDMNNEPYTLEESLKQIEKNNEKSFYSFTSVLATDENLALEYFYKYLYEPIPYKIMYSIEKPKNYSLSNMNNLFNRYLINLYNELFPQSKNSRYLFMKSKEHDITKKNKVKKNSFEKYCEDKNCSFNIIKIILFDKLLKLFSYSTDIGTIKINYLKNILIDYYSFFQEEKIPKANDYIDNNPHISRFSGESQYYKLIVAIWGEFQTNDKYEKILKELESEDNQYISESAKYCLMKLNEKQKTNRDYDNHYYKNILDKDISPINSSSDLFEIVYEIFDKDIRNWIENEGTYKSINELSKKKENKNAEDFIQKYIQLNIENSFLQKGYKKENFIIKREEQLLDDKRLDFTIAYPPFGSIVIELKLAHNNQAIHTRNDAKEYIPKLEQYIKGSKSDFGLFVIFNVDNDTTEEKFSEQIVGLKELYRENQEIKVIGLNCVKDKK